jgi:hypothetical protein
MAALVAAVDGDGTEWGAAGGDADPDGYAGQKAKASVVVVAAATKHGAVGSSLHSRRRV